MEILKSLVLLTFALTALCGSASAQLNPTQTVWVFDEEVEIPCEPPVFYKIDGGEASALGSGSLGAASEYGHEAHDGSAFAFMFLEDQNTCSGASKSQGKERTYKLNFLANQSAQFIAPRIKIKGHGHVNGSVSSPGGPEAGAGSNINVCGEQYLGDSVSIGEAGNSGTLSFDNSKEQWRHGTVTFDWVPLQPGDASQMDEPMKSVVLAHGQKPIWSAKVSWKTSTTVAGWAGNNADDVSYNDYTALSEVGYKNIQVQSDYSDPIDALSGYIGF
jgi:hypothetical protein